MGYQVAVQVLDIDVSQAGHVGYSLSVNNITLTKCRKAFLLKKLYKTKRVKVFLFFFFIVL